MDPVENAVFVLFNRLWVIAATPQNFLFYVSLLEAKFIGLECKPVKRGFYLSLSSVSNALGASLLSCTIKMTGPNFQSEYALHKNGLQCFTTCMIFLPYCCEYVS